MELRSANTYDAVIGWIRLIAPLAEIEREHHPHSSTWFVANEGQLTKKRGVWTSIRRVVACLIKGMHLPTRYELLRTQATQGAQIDHVVSVTEDVKRNVEEVYSLPTEKVSVIGRGIDTAIFNATPRDDYDLCERVRLIYTGNICKEKGLGDVAEALWRVKHPVDLILCGRDLGLLDQVKSSVEKNAPQHRVKYMGMLQQSQIAEELHKSDIFVLCSWSLNYTKSWGEGAAKSLMEAMACGLPVVASDLRTFEGLIEHGHNGLLSQPCMPNSIAKSINQLIDSRELREYCGKNATQTIMRQYAAEVEVNAWGRLLDRGYRKNEEVVKAKSYELKCR